MSGTMMTPHAERLEQSYSHKVVEVIRFEVWTAPVNPGYRRVELVIDGETYEMDAPSAQVLGQALNRAAGGPA